MLGVLPRFLEVDGELYKIDSDFRTSLLIMQLYNSRDLSLMTKHNYALDIIFTYLDEETGELVTRVPANRREAIKEVIKFLNEGEDEDDSGSKYEAKTMDYEKDQHYIFSAINPIFSRDIREDEYLHWWTFCSLCRGISDDSMISHIVTIRKKLYDGKKLEKHEKEFYDKNRDIIDLGERDGLMDNADAISAEIDALER